MQKSRPTTVSDGPKDGELIVLRILQAVLTICGNVLRYLRFLLF
jgi:hypothetical protein